MSLSKYEHRAVTLFFLDASLIVLLFVERVSLTAKSMGWSNDWGWSHVTTLSKCFAHTLFAVFVRSLRYWRHAQHLIAVHSIREQRPLRSDHFKPYTLTGTLCYAIDESVPVCNFGINSLLHCEAQTQGRYAQKSKIPLSTKCERKMNDDPSNRN